MSLFCLVVLDVEVRLNYSYCMRNLDSRDGLPLEETKSRVPPARYFFRVHQSIETLVFKGSSGAGTDEIIGRIESNKMTD